MLKIQTVAIVAATQPTALSNISCSSCWPVRLVLSWKVSHIYASVKLHLTSIRRCLTRDVHVLEVCDRGFMLPNSYLYFPWYLPTRTHDVDQKLLQICVSLTWNLTGSCGQQQRLRRLSRMVVKQFQDDGRPSFWKSISKWKIIRFWWNFVHSSRCWTGCFEGLIY